MLGRVRGTSARARLGDLLLPLLLEEVGSDLGCRTAQLYEHSGNAWRLRKTCGEAAPAVVDSLAGKLPGQDDWLPWVGESYCVLGVGPSLVALHYEDEPGSPRTDRTLLVSAVHHAVAQHLQRGELEDQVDQARVIQTSLLPAPSLRFCDYEIAALSLPAREVGGDAYDYLVMDSDTLALAVADASGHGLPAALQARDVVTGIRMGIERDLKITRLVERLHRVIHQSGLASRFVSLFLGELERNGNLTYVNAGHPPPLLLDSRGIHELSVGGTVLGPFPEATYKLGFAHMDRGSSLVLYSDGVVERGMERGDAFGVERLSAWLRRSGEGSAEEAVAELAARLRAHVPRTPLEDDVTVVLVRRAAAPGPPDPT